MPYYSSPQRVYLIGMTGAGKTSMGKKLAAKTGYLFVDLDMLIEEREGKTISRIFAEDGEAHFRLKEREALGSTFGMEHAIIATGGGTPCFYDNIEQINGHGTSIYLKAPIGMVLSRLSRGLEKRPLLSGVSGDGLPEFVKQLLSVREPYYSRAHHTIELPVKGLETIVSMVFRQ